MCKNNKTSGWTALGGRSMVWLGAKENLRAVWVEESVLNTGICMTLQSNSRTERGRSEARLLEERLICLAAAAEIFVSLVLLSVNRLFSLMQTLTAVQLVLCSAAFQKGKKKEKKKKNHLWKASTPFPSRHASPSGTVSSQPVPHTMGQRCVNLAAPKHTQACCQELDYLREFSAQRQRRHTSLISATFSRERVGLWPMTRDRCSQLIEGDAASAGTATRPR